jgi:iron(III) transport system substrate-binding protein
MVAVCALVAVGCGGRSEPELVVYISADESTARPILAAFEAAHGIRVVPVFDTEATKTTGLAQRLRAERERPRADVFWSSENALTRTLADEGVLAPLPDTATDGGSAAVAAARAQLAAWNEDHRALDGAWYAFAARSRVVVYALDRVAEGDVPRTWMELANDRWKNRIAMADPRFGTTRTHMGVLQATWDRRVMPGYFDAWLEGLAENRIALLTSGNAGVVQAVHEGQFDIGMTDSDDVWAGQAQGFRLGVVFPRHLPSPDEPNGGTLLIPNTVGFVAGSERGDLAAQFMAFLLSPTGESMLAASTSGNHPLGPDVRLPEGDKALPPPEPLRVDWARSAEAADAAVARAMTVLSGARDRPDEPQRSSRGRPTGEPDDAEAEETTPAR